MSLRLALAALALAVAAAGSGLAADGTISTFAGTVGGFAGDGEPATAALLNQPEGMAVAPDGAVLIADSRNHRIRRVAPDGRISTVVGDGTQALGGDGGMAFNASLDTPTDVAFGADGSYFIADSGNHRIRRVAPSGVITTFAGTVQGLAGDGGPATAARMNSPRELATTSDGALLVADAGNHRIRRIASGIITTVAGTSGGFSGDGGPATAAQLNNPRGVTATADGGYLIADAGNNRVRNVGADGIIRTVAGTGAGFAGDGSLATFGALSGPSDVAEISNGGFLVVDTANNRVRRVTPLGTIFTIVGDTAGLAGDGGPASAGLLNTPNALQFAPGGGILVGDTANHRVRKVTDLGQLPDPAVVRSLGVKPVAGNVAVRPRTTNGFIPLRETDLAPNGSVVDANQGTLDVTVRDPSGALLTAQVASGGFLATQPASNLSLADLRLSDPLTGCRGTRKVTAARAHGLSGRTSRRLKVRVKGRFRTVGRYASAIARGTAWTIVDGCDRTVIRVTEGTVTVRIRRTGRLLMVRRGQTRTILFNGRVVPALRRR
jgi:hypothetical protein